jgi:hypothetical protein
MVRWSVIIICGRRYESGFRILAKEQVEKRLLKVKISVLSGLFKTCVKET